MKRILVADDSVTIQKVIALTFADEPFEVKSVGTGAEALELIRTWKPDILLADVIMPQMNGYELCRAIKEQKETASIPVLLLAGTFEAFDGEEARSVGADDSITKPFESGELIEKVTALTGGAPAAEKLPEEPVEETPAGVPSPAQESAAGPALEPAGPTTATPAPEPRGADVSAGEPEPDIWDILSDVDEMSQEPFSGSSEERSPGLGPLEDQAVVDVGSFDVGIDRPEPMPAPPVPGRDSQAISSGFSPEPDSRMEEEPPSAPQQPLAGPETPVVQAEPVTTIAEPEKSRVEDKEKDFFGFEIEGFETAGEEDLLGDAVEEITFDMEKPAPSAAMVDPEASFVVPEPSMTVPPGMGETVSPETMGVDLPETPDPEPPPAADLSTPSGEAVPEPAEKPLVEASETSGTALPEIPLSVSPEKEVLVEPAPEPPVPGFPEAPAAGSRGEAPGQEAVKAPGLPQKPEMGETSVGGLAAAIGPDEAEIRRIVEEKVEKIAWEVVPELAEILIREAIEKLKGGS